jgi:diadenosine tetraphosphate (Ap4A) HIT family hydrolase
MSSPLLFSSRQQFRHTFEQGLIDLLHHDSLGSFILVLANASFDQHVHDYTHHDLLDKYEQLATKYRFLLQDGQFLTDAEDDILVFLKLIAMGGIDEISQTEFRHTENWELQFNHIRSLRPPRISQKAIKGIKLNFNPDEFHFNKPFLKKESFWSGQMLNKEVALFYNKFPFARFHSLLVPDKKKCLPQFLKKEYHQYIWDITNSLSETLPGIGMAYNSCGAFSSINHLHFHLFIKDRTLPITNPRWTHNGGQNNYPVVCKAIDSLQDSWDCIHTLHQQKISYNLIYLPNKVYCIPRKHQGTYPDASWSSGFAWYEVSGGFTTFNHAQFNELECEDLEKELALLKL